MADLPTRLRMSNERAMLFRRDTLRNKRIDMQSRAALKPTTAGRMRDFQQGRRQLRQVQIEEHKLRKGRKTRNKGLSSGIFGSMGGGVGRGEGRPASPNERRGVYDKTGRGRGERRQHTKTPFKFKPWESATAGQQYGRKSNIWTTSGRFTDDTRFKNVTGGVKYKDRVARKRQGMATITGGVRTAGKVRGEQLGYNMNLARQAQTSVKGNIPGMNKLAQQGAGRFGSLGNPSQRNMRGNFNNVSRVSRRNPRDKATAINRVAQS